MTRKRKSSNVSDIDIWIEAKLALHWKPKEWKISETFLRSGMQKAVHKLLGVLGGSIVFELDAFDTQRQTFTLYVLSIEKWRWMKMVLFFALISEEHQCRIEIISEEKVNSPMLSQDRIV
jgi:hypothetical protein